MEYKLSRWNSYIDLGERRGLIYNAFTDSFIAGKNASNDYLNVKENKLEDFTPTFKAQMIEGGALVQAHMDEVKELKDLINHVDDDDSIFHLIVNPTLDCNFHCWYCYENHIKDSVMSQQLVNGIEKAMRSQIIRQKNMKYFQLSFFGGEPLLKFNEVIVPLSEALERLCISNGITMSIHFTTNAFLLDQKIIEGLRKYKVSFQITLDGGREHHNNTRFGIGKLPSFDVILDNVRKLSESGMSITLRINYTKNNLESTREIIDILNSFPQSCRKNIIVDFQRVWQDASKEDADNINSIVRRFRKELAGNGFRCSNNRLMNAVRDSCYGDKTNEMLVNFNGDVFACTARDFKTSSRLGHLLPNGTIEWNEDAVNRRRESKFSKKVCHKCRIAPLCAGGCRTKCVEHTGHDGCSFGYSKEDIDDLILERFEEYFLKETF